MKTVFVSGNFNILHPGHLRLLRFARELGDRLIVAVQSDRLGGSAVHIPEHMRLDGVQCNRWVSEAFIVDEPVAQVIRRLRPDIVVKGKEHEQSENPEREAVAAYGGRLVFSSGEAFFSSLDLIQKNLREQRIRLVEWPAAYAARHGMTRAGLTELIGQFSQLRICVMGDLIVDEYIACEPLGMSQEDPTIVVTPIDQQRFIGGAGIVAAHAAGLGAQVHFFTVTGCDAVRVEAARLLAEYGVDAHLLADETRKTTLKQRFRAGGKTLLRVSHLHQNSIDNERQSQLLNHVRDIAERYDLVIFSDFNYGCLPQRLVDTMIDHARAWRSIMVADSQCSSQIGDLSRFKGMDLLTPTEREARISLRNNEDGLVILTERLRLLSGARNVLLKLGAEGALLHVADPLSGSFETDRIPALNRAPQDLAGAGDCMLTATAMSLTVGATLWEGAVLGSIAAGIQVSRLGNTPLQKSDILQELDS